MFFRQRRSFILFISIVRYNGGNWNILNVIFSYDWRMNDWIPYFIVFDWSKLDQFITAPPKRYFYWISFFSRWFSSSSSSNSRFVSLRNINYKAFDER